jgi:hypothetical protein
MLILEDLRKMKKVSIDKEAMTVTAGGGCQAIDLETPLQGTSLRKICQQWLKTDFPQLRAFQS